MIGAAVSAFFALLINAPDLIHSFQWRSRSQDP
jgi:hypothetical protein